MLKKSLIQAKKRNYSDTNMDLAVGLNMAWLPNYLRCVSEVWCRWVPNSCCQFGCKIALTCTQRVINIDFHMQQFSTWFKYNAF